jgi:uncharacterized protein YraI
MNNKTIFQALILSLSAFSIFSLLAKAQNAVIYSGDPPSTVNIRSGPSTQTSIIQVANDGDSITIQEKIQGSDGVWYKVQFPSGTTGYVRSDLVKTNRNQPSKSLLSCQDTISNVVRKIEASRNLTVQLDYKSRYDYFPNQPTGEVVILSRDSAFRNFLSSPKLLTSFASEIINACDDIRAVTFSPYSGEYITVGLFDNGKVMPFECAEDYGIYPGRNNTNTIKLKWRWGLQFCSL